MFAVFPSVDEFGHTLGFTGGRPRRALLDIDRMVGEKLAGFDGEVLVTADYGLTATENHLDLRRIVEELVGPTVALHTKRILGISTTFTLPEVASELAVLLGLRSSSSPGRLRS